MGHKEKIQNDKVGNQRRSTLGKRRGTVLLHIIVIDGDFPSDSKFLLPRHKQCASFKRVAFLAFIVPSHK